MRVDLLIRNANLATLATEEGIGEIRCGALAVLDGRIAWVGNDRDLPSDIEAAKVIHAGCRWVTPGLIDCHTHILWAGSRSNEFEMRLEGASYRQISESGGGIASTVKATREASSDTLETFARPRIQDLKSQGVTTIEIKSGYGLDTTTELKMLSSAKVVCAENSLNLSATYLGAHSVPPEYEGRPDDYIEHLCIQALPAIRDSGLAYSVDAFCETIAFTPAQTKKYLLKAKELGFKIKLHADQLSDTGGAALIAELGGLSADHVEYTSEESVIAMAEAGTVAVLLPGAFYYLREKRKPPIHWFRQYGVPMAIATDCNPGTSPCSNLLLMMNMVCVLFDLTPSEALAGVTRNAAKALGIGGTTGRLEVGMQADFALFDVGHIRDLSASIGSNPCLASWAAGKLIYQKATLDTHPLG